MEEYDAKNPHPMGNDLDPMYDMYHYDLGNNAGQAVYGGAAGYED